MPHFSTSGVSVQLFFPVVRLATPFKLVISFLFTSSCLRNHSLLLYLKLIFPGATAVLASVMNQYITGARNCHLCCDHTAESLWTTLYMCRWLQLIPGLLHFGWSKLRLISCPAVHAAPSLSMLLVPVACQRLVPTAYSAALLNTECCLLQQGAGRVGPEAGRQVWGHFSFLLKPVHHRKGRRAAPHCYPGICG